MIFVKLNALIVSVCGNEFANEYHSLFTRAFQFKAFIDEFSETAKAGRDLLTKASIQILLLSLV